MVEQRLRYIVARWGWDPKIFCWEIWNELDLFPNFKNLVPQIVAWHRHVAAYLRSVDLNRHLISTSFARGDRQPDIWRVQELDFVSSHPYLSTDLGGKFVDLVRRRLELEPRPYFIGEFGTKFEWLATRPDLDPDAVHVHNGIWASVLAGSSASALFWGWDYNDRFMGRIQRHYGALSRFCANIPWTAAKFRPADFRATRLPQDLASPELRTVGLIGDHLAILWVQNLQHTLANIVEKKPIPPVTGARIVLAGVPVRQRCTIEWWDTSKGEVTRTQEAVVTSEVLSLDLPDLAEDVALKVRW